MARTMIRRIRGRRCATRASFSGFACFGPLDELDAKGVEHLLQQRVFLCREIALGLGFQHRYNADLPMEDAKQRRALRDGDEAAFASLVDRYQGPLLRLAMAYVPSHAVAEEVVQETWLGVLEGLSRFEGRSSLKTWIYRILINRAKTRGVRESRSVPFSPLGASAEDADEPAVDPSRFRSTGYWVDHWAEPPSVWDDDTPEKLLLSKAGLAQIEKATVPLHLT